MQETAIPDSEIKIERNPYDIESDQSEDEEDTASVEVPALLQKLKLLALLKT
jgi:hypothetical protein